MSPKKHLQNHCLMVLGGLQTQSQPELHMWSQGSTIFFFKKGIYHPRGTKISTSLMINVITRQTGACRLKLLNSSHTIVLQQIKFINKLDKRQKYSSYMRWTHTKLREKMTCDSKIIINEMLLYSIKQKMYKITNKGTIKFLQW